MAYLRPSNAHKWGFCVSFHYHRIKDEHNIHFERVCPYMLLNLSCHLCIAHLPHYSTGVWIFRKYSIYSGCRPDVSEER